MIYKQAIALLSLLLTLIVAACHKTEAKPPTNIEKDEKADTDTDSGGESSGGEEVKTDTNGGEPEGGEEDKTDTAGGEPEGGEEVKTDTAGGEPEGGKEVKTDTNGGEPENDGEEATPAPYVFAFDIEDHKVAFTSGGTYTKAVVETNKPAGDARAIIYTSSENAIATVNNTGQVTFVTQGTVTITATKLLEGEYPEATARYTLYLTTKPTTKVALVAEITRATGAHGNEVDLNYIDTSAIKDMSWLFSKDRTDGYELQAFNGDISKWDVSKVNFINSMFYGATSFNQNISGWNVARVTNMDTMFSDATSFNQDISRWNVAKVTNMRFMFRYATSFKQNLNAWEAKINSAVKANGWFRALGMFGGSGLANKLPSWCENVPDCKNKQG